MFKFDDIITLANVGIENATSHTLTSMGAYTLTRFKSEVGRLNKEYTQRYLELTKEAGIEDPQAFDARQKELNENKKRTKAEQKEWEDNNEKLVRLTSTSKVLMNDEVSINVKPMPWDDWHNLKQENKDLHVIFYNGKNEKVGERELFEFVEMLGEGILWTAPIE